ncbi:SDR family NAD(P)-dependent oxidoreductase [Kaistia dalseonensis]|uniref:NAD(P)-dependent dehydrogenase (Short-subunit alcohol dehydrogenase family) n=1 Tax=Kaistia dalseonensis TaxID=410840 RepID=A0ABU0H6Z7_9HYPH|nr:SDR family oxidoreductase [Kaistia dalseonensis]MCX5495491.1 SDR family NAD(P)-dependent oxidoreductase [Kaistia dalseonensis]MDQ0438082.1 NAD(P)-dependent dehydrogenase (short-subunit alcohol dehydrogenase family) [Kaistia dalseonensis]
MTESARHVAIITGGTRGIGAAIAHALAARDVDLLLSGRNRDDEVDALIAALDTKTNVGLHLADAGDPSTATALVELAMQRFGRIDYLVPAAGGAVPGTALSVSPEAWEEAFRVHVHAPFHLFRAAHGALAVRGGAMLLISSVAGLRGCPGTVAYQTVKGALPQMGRALARDHGHEGIRINTVCPGIIETRFHAAMTPEARRNNLENRIPLRHFGTPENVATASIELLTNPFITGETLVIDGGMSMRMV